MKISESELAGHPFFENLDPDLLKIFSASAAHASFNAKQMIYREGNEADQFLLIRQGKVAVELFSAERGVLVIQTVGAGEILGWSWLFPPYRRRFDARAIQDTAAFAWDGIFLRQEAEANHRLGYELLKRFSKIVVERLQATRLQLLDVYGKYA
jgi:CRP/FNR family cyclic AMP-dependent transcriptional regulator